MAPRWPGKGQDARRKAEAYPQKDTRSDRQRRRWAFSGPPAGDMLFASPRRRFGWLDDVAGGRIGRGGRVFHQPGHLCRQLLDLGGPCRDWLFQLGDAALISLFGAGVHIVSGDPTELLSDGRQQVPQFRRKFERQFACILQGGGNIPPDSRLTVSLIGPKAVNGYLVPCSKPQYVMHMARRCSSVNVSVHNCSITKESCHDLP